jgi:hypothetical protein
MLASECQQHIEGVEKQFGPGTTTVLKDIERTPSIDVVRGNIASMNAPSTTNTRRNLTGESYEVVTEARDMTVFTLEWSG